MSHLMEGLYIRLYHRCGLDPFCLVATSHGASRFLARQHIVGTFVLFVN